LDRAAVNGSADQAAPLRSPSQISKHRNKRQKNAKHGVTRFSDTRMLRWRKDCGKLRK
jgi:hypothetical protein